MEEKDREKELARRADYRERNREALREKAREYNSRPEVKERRRLQRIANAEQNKARASAWYWENRDAALHRQRLAGPAYRERNRQELRKAAAEYNNRPEVKERRAAQRIENRDKNRRRCAIWYRENKGHHAELNKQYRKSDKGRSARLQNTRARQARKLKAVPEWADRAKMREIYAEARRLTKELGQKMVVDHIIPLRSPFVCGLHVENNLRVIPEPENIAKGNTFQTDW